MKNNKFLLVGSILLLSVVFIASVPFSAPTEKEFEITDTTSVWAVYEKLGKTKLHAPNPEIKGASAEKGRELAEIGFTTNPQGKRTSRQSPFYTCVACHSTKPESENLADVSAAGRLEYTKKHKTPFLQGSTFYGIVNRATFYNDEYQLKYAMASDIVEAYKDLRKAIQVCATQCSQGRALQDWELESILLYFWTLQLKMGDLQLTQAEKERIENAFSDKLNALGARAVLDKKFSNKMPAHFGKMPVVEAIPAELKDNAQSIENGKAMYEYGCLHCHAERRFSNFALDTSALSLRYLKGKIGNGKRADLFHLTRKGVYSNNGHCNSVTCVQDPSDPPRGPAKTAYMPEYTLEKMSDEQLRDLRIYIESVGKK